MRLKDQICFEEYGEQVHPQPQKVQAVLLSQGENRSGKEEKMKKKNVRRIMALSWIAMEKSVFLTGHEPAQRNARDMVLPSCIARCVKII